MADPLTSNGDIQADPGVPDLGERYVIEGELGRGAMGRVYVAFDQKLRRRVAIKVLAAPMEGMATVARFEREARAAASLSHPNILVIHDVGTTGSAWYIVSELLEGATLRSVLDQGTLQVDAAVRFAIQLAEGLGAAHARGVIHRDLKPENLFVTRSGQLKILDFGVAKVISAPADDGDPAAGGTERTATGAVVGTVGYMSPEQVRGLPADARSDLFSFGAILHEMLSGVRAFRASSPIETAYAILNSEPVPLGPGVPEALRQLVRDCLAKDPEQRPQSARELVGALQRLDLAPAEATVRAKGQRAAHPHRRWLALTAVLLVAVGGAWGLLRAQAPKPSPPSVAVLPFEDLSAERNQDFLADGIAEEILSALSRIEGLRVPGRRSSFFFRTQDADLSQIAARLRVDHVLEGSVRRAGGRVRVAVQLVKVADENTVWSESYDKPLGDVLGLQNEIARAVATNLRLKLLDASPAVPGQEHAVVPEAYAEYLRGRHFERTSTEVDMARAIEAYERAIALDPSYARAYAGLASSLVTAAGTTIGPEAGTTEMWRRARAAAQRAIELGPHLPDGYIAISTIRYWGDQDWLGAKANVEHALSINPRDADARGAYAALLGTLGRLEEAIALAQETHGEDPLSTADATVLAHYYAAVGRYDEAREVLNRALEVAPGTFFATRTLCFVHLLEGRPDDALIRSEGTIWWVRRLVEALAFHDLERDEQSRTALEALKQQPDAIAYQIAQVHAWRGELDEAFEWLSRARAQHDPGLAYVKFDPILRNLRPDPRYATFVASIGLPVD